MTVITQNLLDQLHLRFPISRAAIACWLGDLTEAREFLQSRGRTVREDSKGISWPIEHGLPAGAIWKGQ